MRTGPSLPSAAPEWQPGHVLRSAQFDDVYFSRDGGAAEKRQVFLGGCGFPEGWRAARSVCIGELGFGTGLTFMVTWDAWRRSRAPGARLHYIAVEGYPLPPALLAETIGSWPELRQVGQALTRAYEAPQRGFHRLFLAVGDGDAPVVLTLLFGDAAAMLAQLETTVDAWYLDGFAPDRNPDIWRDEVFAQVARLSRGGAVPTRIASYSVAGTVRRGLEAAGFVLQRAPGFGTKRESLRGHFGGLPATGAPTQQPWFAPAAPHVRGRVAVIGAGLAGTCAAAAMAQRGWDVALIDRRPTVAAEASGNPMAVLMPRLTAGDHLEGRFHAAAWRFALRHLETLSDAGHALERDRCGAIQLAADAGDEERLATIAARGVLPEPYVAALTAAEASEIAGATLPGGGLFFPQGGWLAPGRVCGALASCAGRFIHGEVAALRRADGALQVIASDGGVIARADAVILAAAVEVRRLADAAWLPLTARRGQLSLFPATRASARLRTVVAAGGYVTPAARGRHAVGATFDWVSADGAAPEVVAEDHDRNLAGLGPLASQLFGDIDPAAADGRAGLRCMTPDHLPVAGPLPDHAAYLSDYGALRHGQPWRRYPTATYQPGIYVLSGLGARGLVTAPLAAEVVACHITGEPWPLEWDLVAALHPARFLVRDLKRLRA